MNKCQNPIKFSIGASNPLQGWEMVISFKQIIEKIEDNTWQGRYGEEL